MNLEKFQGVITKYNTDSNGSIISVIKEGEQQVHPLKFNITTGIIDELEGFTVLNKEMYAVQNYDDIQSANQYWVDYDGGRVYFHSSLKGSAIRYRYGDKGYELLNATRIFTKLDEKGNVVELLSELIDKTREYIAILGTFEQATIVIKKLEQDIVTGNELHNNLVEDITIATPLQSNLHDDIVEASKWKDQLNSDVVEGKALYPLLEENVSDGKILQPLLDDNIAVGSVLQEKLHKDIQDVVVFKDQFSSDVVEGKILYPLLNKDVVEGKVLQDQLSKTIEETKEDIATIGASGNEVIMIDSSEWVYNSDSMMYEKEISHNCNSEYVHLTCNSYDTKDALFLPWRIIDKSTILIKSDTRESVVVGISARYYRPFIFTGVTETEIVDARQGEEKLLDNMNRKINYEDFTANSIN